MSEIYFFDRGVGRDREWVFLEDKLRKKMEGRDGETKGGEQEDDWKGHRAKKDRRESEKRVKGDRKEEI